MAKRKGESITLKGAAANSFVAYLMTNDVQTEADARKALENTSGPMRAAILKQAQAKGLLLGEVGNG